MFRRGPLCLVQDGGGAVDLIVELFLLPLIALSYPFGNRWCWCERVAFVDQTPGLFRYAQVAVSAGLPPAEYALHSLRVRGATCVDAGGGDIGEISFRG